MCKLLQVIQNFIALIRVTEMANRTYNVFAAINKVGNGKLVYEDSVRVGELENEGKIPDFDDFYSDQIN